MSDNISGVEYKFDDINDVTRLIDGDIEEIQSLRMDFRNLIGDIGLDGVVLGGKFGDLARALMNSEIETPLDNMIHFLDDLKEAIRFSSATTSATTQETKQSLDNTLM